MAVKGRVCVGVCAVHALLSLLSALVPSVAAATSFIPAHCFLVHYYIWNIVTYPFFDTSIPNVLLSIAFTISYGRFLEKKYSTKDFLRILAFTQICTGLALFWISFVLFFLTRIEEIFFLRYCGLGVWVAAFMVGMKLELPEQRVLKFLSQLRFKHLPSICVALWGVVFLVLPRSELAKEFMPFVLSTYFTWFYLRFLRTDPETDILGNVSDGFSFASFFPIARRPISLFSDICLRIGVVVGVFKSYASQNRLFLGDNVANVDLSPPASPVNARTPPSYVSPSAAAAVADLVLHVADDSAAKRRRLLAIQAIDEQMAKKQQQSSSSAATSATAMADSSANGS